MLSRFFALTLSCGTLAIAASGFVCAQDSSRPIRIYAGNAGGTVDFNARIIGERLSASMGQPVIIDNRSGVIDVRALIVAKSPPDGQTLILTGPTFWLASFERDNVPFDAVKEFTHIVPVAQSPAALVVHPSLPVKSVKDLVALAKARPGQIDYAIGSLNGTAYLSGELFKQLAGVNLVAIPFKGGSGAMTAVIGGEVPVTFTNVATAGAHFKSGQVRVLGVTSPKRSALAPELPTIAESGLPNYEMVSTYGLLGPANMPAALVNRFHREVTQIVTQADVRQRFLSSGVEVISGSPQDLTAMIVRQRNSLGKIIKEARAAAK